MGHEQTTVRYLSRWALAIGWLGSGLIVLPAFALAPAPIRPPAACPDDLQALTALMLRDLPSYANRVVQRSFDRSPRNFGTGISTSRQLGTILLAGRPEFEPLTLGPGVYAPTSPQADQPQQIFFTTLERQYVRDRIVYLQHYHWLFLTQGDGWLFVALFSQLGDTPPGEPPTPPQNTSEGDIAQAVRLWLRDCRSGAVAQP